jgi:hypothetical protein
VESFILEIIGHLETTAALNVINIPQLLPLSRLPQNSMIDLHTHATASDGTSTTEELVTKQADTVGMRALAITDHDTLAGVDSVLPLIHRYRIISSLPSPSMLYVLRFLAEPKWAASASLLCNRLQDVLK